MLLVLAAAVAGATPDESLDTWRVRANTQNTYHFGAAYGNGTWVVTTVDSNVFTSPNGATWTKRVNSAGGRQRAIAFGADIFVTCGFDGGIMTSPDGITWTRRDSLRPSDRSPGWGWSVLHANGLFVAAAGYSSGLLVTSPDGIQWSRTLEETNRQWRGLAFGNGVFVAAGPYLLATSSNGLQWTRQEAGTNFWPVSVTFGNGTFVGVGGGSVFTSSNGVNWMKRDLVPTAYELYNVTFGGGVFVALDPTRRIWTSTDGEKWTPQLSTPTASLLNATYAQGRFVAVGGSQIWQSEAIIPTAPLIVQQPADQLLRSGRTYTNRVVVESALAVTYQWQLNGTDIPGATNDVLIVPNASASLSGQHRVVVANDTGSEVSTSARVLIADPPTITLHPLSQEVPPGGTVTLSVSAAGTLPLSFRWRRGGSTVAFFQVNQNHSFLTLTDIQAAGEYTVAVSNIVSSPGVLSEPAMLTLLADSDHDGLSDAFEVAYGLDPLDPADAALDSDHDGYANIQEYQLGTDPTDPLSLLRLDRIRVGDTTTIEFTATMNRTYTLQFTDSFGDPLWQKLDDVPARPFQRTVSIDDPGAPLQRFYRLVLPRQP